MSSRKYLEGTLSALEAIDYDALEKASQIINSAVKEGRMIACCGNGGSATQAMHLSEELVARFEDERPGVKCIHFCDPGVLTCWSNDYDYSSVFSRQVETYLKEGDILISFSTSGNSENILKALEVAKSRGVKTISLLGKDGGSAFSISDCPVLVKAQRTSHIQEGHLLILHYLCQEVDKLFK